VIGEQIIGALDVQSAEPNAFQTEDINLLKILADQIAIAIYNARIYETMEEVFERSQKTTSASLQDAWRILQSDGAKIGYMASAEGIAPVQRPWMTPYNRKALAEKQTVAESGINAALAVPIRLRGEVIGVLDIHTRSEHEWDEDEVDIAEAVAERLSLALETALLLKATQRRAEIERITTDIAGKITASTQIDIILRTAAEELSRILGGSEVLVQLHTDMADSPTKEK
jgi:GAF domain-containing protein